MKHKSYIPLDQMSSSSTTSMYLTTFIIGFWCLFVWHPTYFYCSITN